MKGREKRPRIPLSPLSFKLKAAGIAVGAASVFAASAAFLRPDAAKFIGRLRNIGTVLRRFMVVDFSVAGEAAAEMLSSLAIALA
ncbi:MAG: hypothetical protein LBK23_05470, partial [Oscillospiraceae bacterium]|nr:hypothetical protein [Oscillospiraceae bacterium]